MNFKNSFERCPACKFNLPFKKERMVPVYKTEDSVAPYGYTFIDLSRYENILPEDIKQHANIRIILHPKDEK